MEFIDFPFLQILGLSYIPILAIRNPKIFPTITTAEFFTDVLCLPWFAKAGGPVSV
jgi:hypothetical protein